MGDNISFSGEYKTASSHDFLNVYKYYTKEKIWPRGFPLLKILNEKKAKVATTTNNIGIWQGLANQEADVDAIYRLTINKQIDFNDGEDIVLEKETICPFNSQNTFFRKELFPLLYLPAFVTFRFTDILRGLIAQPLMWQEGYHLGFSSASVYQERNEHNFLNDFESEIPMYLQTENVIKVVKEALDSKASLLDNLENAYKALYKAKIVTQEELILLSEWVNFFKN